MSCTKLQLPPEPLTRGLPPPDPQSLCPQLNLLNPPEKNSWVRHCLRLRQRPIQQSTVDLLPRIKRLRCQADPLTSMLEKG